MKRFGFLLALAFIPFFIIGYLFAGLAWKGNHSIKSEDIIAQAASYSQKNYLYIQVETVPNQPVHLVSIWALFIVPSEKPMGTFMRLYPTNKTIQDALLASELVFDSQLDLNSGFYELLSEYYRITWNGSAIFNQNNLQTALANLDAFSIKSEYATHSDGDSDQMLQSLCTALLSKSLVIPTLLSSDDFSSSIIDIPFGEYVDMLQWIATGQPFANCEIQEISE